MVHQEGGVVDDTGQVIGVLRERIDDDGISRPTGKSVVAQNDLLRNGGGMPGFAREGIMLPRENRGFALPVMDERLLSALNAAGQHVRAVANAMTDVSLDVRIAAYPLANCITYSGFVEEWNPLDRRLGSNLARDEFDEWRAALSIPMSESNRTITTPTGAKLSYDQGGYLHRLMMPDGTVTEFAPAPISPTSKQRHITP